MSYTVHSRSFRENRFVYPVLSRRSKGISVGINLNPDRICNFDCIYCQVDRKKEKGTDLFSGQGKINLSPFPVDIQRICSELKETLDLVKTGQLFSAPPFDRIPPELRRLSDIAISGDGEPTTFPKFYEVVREVIRVKNENVIPAQAGIQDADKRLDSCFRRNDNNSGTFVGENMGSVPLVLITNASGLNRPEVQEAIDLMYLNHGEVWAKLDAGSDAYYKRVSRSLIPLREILRNIIGAAKRRPLVIQSCFNRIEDTPPSLEEIEDYAHRLRDIKESGGEIRLVQIYTVARPPSEDCVTPLSKEELNFIARKVQETAGLPAEIFC